MPNVGHPTKEREVLQEIGEEGLAEAERDLHRIVEDWKDGRLDMGDIAGLALISDALYQIQNGRFISATEGNAQLRALRQ